MSGSFLSASLRGHPGSPAVVNLYRAPAFLSGTSVPSPVATPPLLGPPCYLGRSAPSAGRHPLTLSLRSVLSLSGVRDRHRPAAPFHPRRQSWSRGAG